MLDFGSRIDDLADKLAREYSIEDRSAIEILLSALVHCPRTAGCWLILETNWYSRECLDAWFSFGESWVPCSLPRLRARSPWRTVEAETKEWVDAPSEERLFVEPDFERYPRFHRLTQAQYILQRCLRVRTRAPRASTPLRALDQREQDRRTDTLAAATRYVLEDHAALRGIDPPRFVQPPNFLYHLELLQRLAPWYPDWEVLVKAFALVAVRRAYLHGEPETGPEDNRAIARVAADSIPVWITKALRLLMDAPAEINTLEKAMALEEKSRRSGHGAHRELVRLRKNGIIEWHPRKLHWSIVDTHRQGLLDIMDGHAFGQGQ